ncbi:helix-turn-helix domain-containing protein [Micromonospora zhanjiangensis]|uniref:Helix-turn-helix domain-containing protein n=1 Tax=Micromonospora zhanjiangensis TaxID=1522057 RepID=A0ABV8KNX1_9ACTN
MARLPVRAANCPRCGGRLARDNDSGRCAACQAAERDRLVAPPTVPASFWEHEPVRQALSERHLGRVIRAYRCHPYHGRDPLPQRAVASWLGITQAQLSRVENGPAMVHLDRLMHWAQLINVPAELLWFKLPDENASSASTNEPPTVHHRQGQAAAPHFSITEIEGGSTFADNMEAASQGGDVTDRRRFTKLAALAGVGATVPFDLFAMQADIPRNIGMEQVRFASSLAEEFRRADAAAGADGLCDLAIQVHARLSAWVGRASYSRAVGDALQNALADLANQVAWLAIDAERRSEARPYLNDAIGRTRMINDPREEVRALACLALLTREDRPGEALQAAEAALRIAAGWATPRLTTLLHLRAAHAYAYFHDLTGYNSEMLKAQRDFERGTHEDDPAFIQFLTEQEMDGIQGLSYLTLGRPDRAAGFFRSVTANPSDAHRRNHVMYTLDLADALKQEGDKDGAASTALAVLPAAAEVNSRRMSRMLIKLRSDLGGSARATPTVREFLNNFDSTAAKI